MPPFGFWTIQALNISFCAVPKSGSSMIRQIVARGAGTLKENKCFYPWSDEKTKELKSHGVTNIYTANTTNIAVIRDPWTRAVSSFNDQMNRGYIPRSHRNVSSFLHFLRKYATIERQHHTGIVANKCTGHSGARFDHLIDLEDIASFAKVARLVPAFGALVNHGWKHCTNGDPRLYMVGSIATHRNRDSSLKYNLCTPKTISEVCRVYHEDYALYERLGHPYHCSCTTMVTPPSVLPTSRTVAHSHVP